MTRKRLAFAAAVLLVVACTPMALMMAQPRKKTPADKIGISSKTAQAITKPVTVVKEKWPTGVPPLGPLLEFEGKASVRLPSSFRSMNISGNDSVKVVYIRVSEDRISKIINVTYYADTIYSALFDILSRIEDVVPERDIISLWPKIEELEKRSDEQKFTDALAATMDAYRASADFLEAANLCNGLMFRADYHLIDGVSVTRYDSKHSRVYLQQYNACGQSMCRLWVFSRDGALLGKMLCSMPCKLVALGMADSMGQKPEVIPVNASRQSDPKPSITKNIDDINLRDPEKRLRKIALSIIMYRGEYGKNPASLQELADSPLIENSKLIEDIVYIRPAQESKEWGYNPPMMLYYEYESWPKDGIRVVLADGVFSKIDSEEKFRDMKSRATGSR